MRKKNINLFFICWIYPAKSFVICINVRHTFWYEVFKSFLFDKFYSFKKGGQMMFMLYNSIAPQLGEYRNDLVYIFLSFWLIVYLTSFLQVSYLLLKTETLAESFMLTGRAFQPFATLLLKKFCLRSSLEFDDNLMEIFHIY